MCYREIFINYFVGQWIVQQTSYNLISSTVRNIKLDNDSWQYSNKNTLSKSYWLLIKIKDHILSPDHQITKLYGFMTIIFQPINYFIKTNYHKIFVLDLQNKIPITKYYTFSNNVLTIKANYMGFSTIEKFWQVSKSLILTTSIIKYNTRIICIIFESRIFI